MKMGGPGDPASQMPLLQCPQSSASRTPSRLLAERFILTNYSSQDLTIVLIFPGFFPNVITPSIMKQSIEHNIHNPKRSMGGLGTFDGEWMFVIIQGFDLLKNALFSASLPSLVLVCVLV